MIKNHSDDPNVELAAQDALAIVKEVLAGLPSAKSFDYGGQQLNIGEYDVCTVCTKSIAESQQAHLALRDRGEGVDDPIIKEHLELAAELFEKEAEIATIRAELHNGFGTEKILNELLGFSYGRAIPDSYNHSHEQGTK